MKTKRPALWVGLVIGLIGSCLVGGVAAAGPTVLRAEAVEGASAVVRLDPDQIRRSTDRQPHLLLADFPIGPDQTVDLELERFSVTGPRTRFVRGNTDGSDHPLDYDPSRNVLLRGRVVGRPGSRVLLTLGEGLRSGYIDPGDGRRLRLSSRGAAGVELPAGQLAVFPALGEPSLPPGVPLCSVGDSATAAGPSAAGSTVQGTGDLGLARGVRQLELAVETDYEFFELFEDADAAATYVVALYAEISEIYIRDVNTRIDLTFVRIWDQPNDIVNGSNPLSEFTNYWNANMSGVDRDVAQLLSGRRDYPAGGQAWLSALCGSQGYSIVGYLLGSFPDPSMPSPYHYDISVAAHEIGHSCGANHTHAAGNAVDTCNDPQTIPQRGTIMSYCGQTWSGGNANRDAYFHAVIVDSMDAHISNSACVVNDCNANGVDDLEDTGGGVSPDVNGNGVPDSCEDCNGNAVLDSVDIGLTTSLDLNRNDVPDECEPDCNNNQFPDDKDLADGRSLDAYGNGIPDECEADCDGSSVSDFTEIQADMPTDVDRNTIPDSCQDCDADGITDHDELGFAHSLWVTSGLNNTELRQFFSTTGVRTALSNGNQASLVHRGQDLIVTPWGHVLVSSAEDDRVMEFDLAGNYLGNLVAPGLGGLSDPAGLLILEPSILLVVSRATAEVLAYDAFSGLPLGPFINAGAGGLTAPFGLTEGPGGNLFVTSEPGSVLEFDRDSGAYVRTLVAPPANAGLDQPRGLVFKPDGDLLVASYGTDQVLAYDGPSGTSLGRWALSGTGTTLTQTSPWGIRIGPNGNVFVVRTGPDFGSSSSGEDHHEHQQKLQEETHGGHDGDDDVLGDDQIHALHLSNAQIYEFDVRNGNFIRTLIGGNDHGLEFPTGFDFIPGWSVDCNANLLQDDCDTRSGSSADLNLDEIPDECQVDCNGNGTLDRLDIIPFGSQPDCNFNLLPDSCDLTDGTSIDCNLNSLPDECEQFVRPPEVPLLLAEKEGLLQLTWTDLGELFAYDLVAGSITTLHATGEYDAAFCAVDDLSATFWKDDLPDPPPGDGRYYLVRAVASCGAGTFGSPGHGVERLPDPGCP